MQTISHSWASTCCINICFNQSPSFSWRSTCWNKEIYMSVYWLEFRGVKKKKGINKCLTVKASEQIHRCKSGQGTHSVISSKNKHIQNMFRTQARDIDMRSPTQILQDCPTNSHEVFIVVWFTTALGSWIIKLTGKLHAENGAALLHSVCIPDFTVLLIGIIRSLGPLTLLL